MRRTALALAAVLAVAACSTAPTSAPTGRTLPVPSPTSLPSSPRAAAALRFAAVGDIGDGSPRAARVAAAIAVAHENEPIDLLLLLGDLIYPDGDPRQYDRKFARPYRPVLDAGIEISAALGNHDLETDVPGIMRLFGMPSRWYTFTRGPVQFFALDSSTGAIGPEQRAWLEGELQRSRAPWKVAFMHVPPFSSGRHGPNHSLQRALAPLFSRYRVQVALAGHDHNYERMESAHGTTYIVSGGGCCPQPAGTSRLTARAATGLHFVLVEVAGEAMTVEAIGADGRLLDRATIPLKAAA